MNRGGKLTSAWRGGFDGRSGWWFSFEYEPDKVEKLKAAVPHTARSWDSLRKAWWVALEYEQTILALWPEFEAYKSQLPLLF